MNTSSDAKQATPTLTDELKLANDPEAYLTSQGFDDLEPAEMNKLLEAVRVAIKYRQSEKDAKDAEAERGPGASLLQELLALSREPGNWTPSYIYDPVSAIANCVMRHSQIGCRWEQSMASRVLGYIRMPALLMYRLKTARVRVCGECFFFLKGHPDTRAVAYALTHGPDRRRLSDDCSNMTVGEYESILAGEPASKKARKQ